MNEPNTLKTPIIEKVSPVPDAVRLQEVIERMNAEILGLKRWNRQLQDTAKYWQDLAQRQEKRIKALQESRIAYREAFEVVKKDLEELEAEQEQGRIF